MPHCTRYVSSREELANAITHGLGAVLSVAGLVALIVLAGAEPWRIVTFSIFGASLVTLYLASTLYHCCRPGRVKDVFRALDHAAIYFLIAGTYTPFMLVLVGGAWGWSIVVSLWAMAIAGTVFKARCSARSSLASTLIYVAMGWIGLIAAGPIVQSISADCLLWVLAGGLAYTGGVVFFVWDRLPFNHAIWHLFVLKGSACHFLAVLLYVQPVT